MQPEAVRNSSARQERPSIAVRVQLAAMGLNPVQDVAQQFQVFLRRVERLLKALEQLLFSYIPLVLGQTLMKYDPFFQAPYGSPECAFDCFAVFFAQAFWGKSMPDEACELRKLAALHFEYRTVAFRAVERDLVARWL